MLDFLSPVLSVVSTISAVVSLRSYFSIRNLERNRPREDLRAALRELRNDLLELSSAWAQLGVYLSRSNCWDPTAPFGAQTSRDDADEQLSGTIQLYERIFEYNKKIAGSMLDIFGSLGRGKLGVNDELVRDAKSLIEKLHELRCGDLDNARADALTNEVIARASALVEDLQTALNLREMSAGADS